MIVDNTITKEINIEHISRNSSVELLRLIAILAIIGSHFVGYGISDILSREAVKAEYDFSLAFDFMFLFGGAFGNSLFILITGYFMIN